MSDLSCMIDLSDEIFKLCKSAHLGQEDVIYRLW